MLTAVVVSVAKVASIVSTLAAPRVLFDALGGAGVQSLSGLAGLAGSGIVAVLVPVLFAAALLTKAQRMATTPDKRPLTSK
jgi:hypothetical protein